MVMATPRCDPDGQSGSVAGMTDQPNDGAEPPAGLPRYRVLTGPDDDKFCRRVSEALDLGYRLYGSPAVTFDGQSVIVAQGLVWPGGEPPGQSSG
jgi:hypothetical protein